VLEIAIASGKGGTGKTTLSTNLARVLSASHAVSYVDCDVEAPNGGLFLQPRIDQRIPVYRPVPKVDESRCDFCGECSDFCQYNAIAVLKERVIVFPELCHGCGGCLMVCPRDAISERQQPIGVVELGEAGSVAFAAGRLRIGETATVRLIRELRERARKAEITILDAPPGTSCPVVTSVYGVDVVVLVTEPTPFGLHDLRVAVETMRKLGIPMGVVVNRAGIGDNRVEEYCRREEVPIWGRIPDERQVAEAYSRGELASEVLPEFRERIEAIAGRLLQEVAA